MSQSSDNLNNDIIGLIAEILAENGLTKTLCRLKLCSKWTRSIKVSEPLIFEHIITEEDNIFKIPITINQSQSITINWGDGKVEKIENEDSMFLLHRVVRHEYVDISEVKKYRIGIFGSKYSLNHIGYLENWADGITDFITLGNLGIRDLSGLFLRCKKFNGVLSENFNTSGVVDMSRMFYCARSFNQSLNFDTSNVVSMKYMFSYAKSFNRSFSEGNFDTSNVVNMEYMFSGARKFNQSLNFDTSSVVDMNHMFSCAESFNQSLGPKFDTSNVTNMACMFYHAESFNQSLGPKFDTSKVVNMRSMFSGAKSFNQSLNFDMSNVVDMKFMFYGALSFNKEQNFDMSNVVDTVYMFEGATSFNKDLNRKPKK